MLPIYGAPLLYYGTPSTNNVAAWNIYVAKKNQL